MNSELTSARITRISSRWRGWPEVVLITTLALLPCLFFWRLLTPNPADRLQIVSGDFTEQYFPLRAFAAQEWVNGHIPLWNPYLYGGQPALADIQSGALYPPHVLQALILGWGGPWFGREIGFPLAALQFQVIIHFSLAAVGTYLFSRFIFLHSPRSPLSTVSLRRARFGGVIAALGFTYGGYLTGFPVQQLTILEVSAWLPWVMWAVHAAINRPPTTDRRPPKEDRRPKTVDRQPSTSGPQPPISSSQLTIDNSQLTIHNSSPLFWGALAFAMAILAGHPQTVLYIFYLSLAYTLFQTFFDWPRRFVSQQASQTKNDATRNTLHVSRFKCVFPPLFSWLLIILLGAAIAAAQLLPTLEFIGLSLREKLSYQAVSSGLPLNEFIAILYPGFFGGSPQYVGLVTLVLIAAAWVLARSRRAVYFWTGAALISLLLAFGGHTFLYSLFYLAAPGFDAVRQQERAFLVYSFSAAVLAGYGALALTGPLPFALRTCYYRFERRLRQAALLALFLTGFFIYGSAAVTARGDEVNLFYGVLRHHLFGLLGLAGTLLLLQLRLRRRLRRGWGMGLLALWLTFTLFTVNWRFNLEMPPDPPSFTANGVVRFLQNELADSGRIAGGGLLPGGHSAASVYNLPDLTGNTPLQIAAVAAFLQQMPSWRLWQLMAVRYVIDQRNLSSGGLALVFAEGDFKVFEVLDPFPPAWLVGETEVIPDDQRALARLASDDFDLRRRAVVAESLPTPLAEAGASTAQVARLSPTRLTATVEAAGPHLLVLSQIYYPGWQAQLDGEPVELRRVNVVQQGVLVPPGRHTIEVVFRPASFRWGVLISALGVVG
ncbi:MAG: YfhO family protein, partial [Chloroflexota bacterium]